MDPEPYRAPITLDCPRCGKTSAIDPTVVPIQCPECNHVLSAMIECGGCRERLPYQGDPNHMTTCPKCGKDPLTPARSATFLKQKIGSAAMILAALATIALLGMTAYMLYRRFIAA